MSSDQKSRVDDFNQRAAFVPESVYRHRSQGWLYIPVHHFADETDVAVLEVDCWCLLGNDAALLEWLVSEISKRRPGFYAWVDGDAPCWPKLFAVLPLPLTRDAVELAMQRFVELGFPDPLISRLRPDDSQVRLSG